MTEFTILVALEIEAEDHERAHTWAQFRLDQIRVRDRDSTSDRITAYWVAEDDRVDGSDNESAVFVHRGRQYDASLALARLGYAPEESVKGEPDGERFIVTTTVTDPRTGQLLPPVSLDNPGVTRTKNDARDLRNSYVLTIGAAGAKGSPARIYPEPSGADREAWIVEYLSPTTGELVTRECVTFIPAEDHPPHVRHTQR